MNGINPIAQAGKIASDGVSACAQTHVRLHHIQSVHDFCSHDRRAECVAAAVGHAEGGQLGRIEQNIGGCCQTQDGCLGVHLDGFAGCCGVPVQACVTDVCNGIAIAERLDVGCRDQSAPSAVRLHGGGVSLSVQANAQAACNRSVACPPGHQILCSARKHDAAIVFQCVQAIVACDSIDTQHRQRGFNHQLIAADVHFGGAVAHRVHAHAHVVRALHCDHSAGQTQAPGFTAGAVTQWSVAADRACAYRQAVALAAHRHRKRVAIVQCDVGLWG